MRIIVISVISVFAISGCTPKADDSQKTAKVPLVYEVPDDTAITKAVYDAYTCISFKSGSNPAFSEIKNYFIPNARLINFRTDTAQAVDIDQFIDLYKQFVQANGIHSFYEEELFGRNEQFGNIAQRISSYETFINRMDSATERGVNSFQLIKTGNKWKVSSIIWDVEKPSLPIPGYYLKADSSRK